MRNPIVLPAHTWGKEEDPKFQYNHADSKIAVRR